MVLAAPQLTDALNFAKRKIEGVKPFVVYPSPQGVLISQEIIETLARQDHVIIFCGHYEGIDERFVEKYVDLEISIGDCVLTGGEIPAMLIIDAMSRLVPGVVGKNKAVIEDSFYRGMLDNPNYTRPAEWEGERVPEVLLSGNDKAISQWRRKIAVSRTLTRRPDLLSRASIREYISESVNLAVFADNQSVNLAGLSELCKAFGVSRPYIIAHTRELRDAMKKLCPEAKILGRLEKLKEFIDEHTLVVKVFSGARNNSLHSLEIKRKCIEHDGGILFIFADDENLLESMRLNELWELEEISGYIYENDFDVPLNIKIGIALDRLLGKR